MRTEHIIHFWHFHVTENKRIYYISEQCISMDWVPLCCSNKARHSTHYSLSLSLSLSLFPSSSLSISFLQPVSYHTIISLIPNQRVITIIFYASLSILFKYFCLRICYLTFSFEGKHKMKSGSRFETIHC